MSYPILYEKNEQDFGKHNGIGVLSDCASCIVTEVANGSFELSMKYPIDGIHFSEIKNRSLIYAKPNNNTNPQLFRVYSITVNINKIAQINARHISYDLSGFVSQPFEATSANDALQKMDYWSGPTIYIDNPFTFEIVEDIESPFVLSVPRSVRSLLMDTDGSILSTYGGEFELDNYTVRLHKNRGKDSGLKIIYGSNMTNYKLVENDANLYTGVYPYFVDQDGILYEVPEKIVYAKQADIYWEFDYTKIKPVDLGEYFQETPTADQLREAAISYMRTNQIGYPDISLTVSFANLEQSEEYKDSHIFGTASLFDTVTVADFWGYKIDRILKVVTVVYDVLLDRINSVTLGSTKNNIADTIAQQQKHIEALAKLKNR